MASSHSCVSNITSSALKAFSCSAFKIYHVRWVVLCLMVEAALGTSMNCSWDWTPRCELYTQCGTDDEWVASLLLSGSTGINSYTLQSYPFVQMKGYVNLDCVDISQLQLPVICMDLWIRAIIVEEEIITIILMLSQINFIFLKKCEHKSPWHSTCHSCIPGVCPIIKLVKTSERTLPVKEYSGEWDIQIVWLRVRLLPHIPGCIHTSLDIALLLYSSNPL